MYEYKAKILNIVDGDTFDLDIDLGFYTHLQDVRVRLLDVNTPEKRGNESLLGLIVKDYLDSLIKEIGPEVIIRSEKSDTTTYTDSFGRWLVYIKLANGKDLSELLTELGVNKAHESYSADKVLALGRDSKFYNEL